MNLLVVAPRSAGSGAERQAFLLSSALRVRGTEVHCLAERDSWLARRCARAGIAVETHGGRGWQRGGWLAGRALGRSTRPVGAEWVLGFGETGARLAANIGRVQSVPAAAVISEAVDPRSLVELRALFATDSALLRRWAPGAGPALRYLPPAVPDFAARHPLARERARRALKLADGEIAVAVPGPIDPALGQEQALEVFEQLGDTRLRPFLLGGYRHPYGRELRLLAAQSAAAAGSMIGPLPEPGSWRAFDLCLAPVQRAHAAHHALLAMNFGLPLVGSPLGALGDMIETGGNGYLAAHPTALSLTEALVVALDEGPARLVQMGRHSRRRFARQFSLRQMVQAFEDGLRAAALDAV